MPEFQSIRLYDLLKTSTPGRYRLDKFLDFKRSSPGLTGVAFPDQLSFGNRNLPHLNYRYILQVPKGRIATEHGYVLTPDWKLVFESNLLYCLDAAALSEMESKVFSCRKIPGTSVSIAGQGAHSYYNWIYYFLPRLKLITAAGVSYDYLITSPLTQDFQREALALSGVPEEKIIECGPDEIIQTDQLLFPSFLGHHPWKDPEIRMHLQQLFLAPELQKVRSSLPYLYISRQSSPCRTTSNEAEILPVLEKFGIIPVQLETMTVREQAALLFESKLVIGATGMGFANMLFTPLGATWLELSAPEFQPDCYRAMAEAMGMNHRRLLTEPDPTDPREPYWQNVILPPDKLAEWLTNYFANLPNALSAH